MEFAEELPVAVVPGLEVEPVEEREVLLHLLLAGAVAPGAAVIGVGVAAPGVASCAAPAE